MKKFKLLLLGLTVILISCVSSNNGASGTAGINGTYYAKLPCTPCNGLIVDLLLENNHTYSMVKYPKNTQKEIYENGTWQKQGNRIKLTPAVSYKDNDNSDVFVQDFIIKSDNNLLLLDKNGNPYKNAQKYTFEKK